MFNEEEEVTRCEGKRTQDMEEPCMFQGSCESFLVTGEAGDKEAFSTILTGEFGILPSGDGSC